MHHGSLVWSVSSGWGVVTDGAYDDVQGLRWLFTDPGLAYHFGRRELMDVNGPAAVLSIQQPGLIPGVGVLPVGDPGLVFFGRTGRSELHQFL
jgi:hypothetical protein